MIADRIMEYLRGDLAGGDPVALDTAARFFRMSLARNLTNGTKDEARDHLSASSPWYCARRILYTLNGAERAPLNPRSRLAFLMGDMVEQSALLLSRLSGVDVVTPGPDGRQEGGETTIAGEAVRYHIDATVRDPNGAVIPVDFKSMAEYGFDEFEKAVRDPSAKWHTEERWGYLAQLRIYMQVKAAPYGVFLAVSKNTGHVAEMHVPPDPAWWLELEERVRYVAKARAATALPPRPPWAVSEIKSGANLRPDGTKGAVEEIKHWRCGYCPFVRACWPGFDVVPLASKPVWRKAVEAAATKPVAAEAR